MLYSKQGLYRRRVLIGVVIVVLGTGVWGIGYRPAQIATCAHRLMSMLVYPLLKIQQQIIPVLDRIRLHRMTMHELRTQLAMVQKDNELLIAELVQLYATNHDQALAHELAQVRQRYAYADAIGARVMLKILTEQEQSMLIDAGEKAGVEVDMVAVYNNCIVGKVTHVYPWYSKMLLITDRACKIAAYCVTTGVQGIHEGIADSSKTALTHINHYDQPKEGEIVMSSGQGIIFPQGFALGRIGMFTKEGLWLNAVVEPMISIAALECCVLFKKGQRPILL